MKLSILIPTLHKRSGLLRRCLQAIGTHDQVEVLAYADDGRISTGNKRNALVQQAKGEYVAHVDDDDLVSPDYIPEILKAIEQAPDAITFNGWMTTDGGQRVNFNIQHGNPYTAVEHQGKIVYLRFINHLCPVRREIALQVPFPNKTLGEDYDWAVKLKDSGLIKTSVHIDKELYHYDYKSIKP